MGRPAPWEPESARPHRSSRFNTGTRSITWEKLVRSLARVRPTTAPSRARRTGRGARAAAATPRAAPSALAPASPSIERSASSSGSRAAEAPSTGPSSGAAGEASAGAEASSANFTARPGRRSKRLTRLALAAIRAPSTRVSSGPRRSRYAEASPVAPIPAILTAPVVTSPWANAPRCPRSPLARVFPARSS
ncbi:hypothetical protein KGD82_09500 [Nocardiopsis eucommiae]|uniref:Uncharacterized protein n=1 Tax=Nocardiopsis eucommiae TaxID=2831970 RepID=A0A975LB99_9ACTN|nr:hypothetical protein KGD82_09500 [Nocardiopsis eucommiae]